jgi:heterocyst specific transport system permease protein
VTPLYMGFAPFKNPLTGQDRLIIVLGFDPSKPALNEPGVIQNAHLLKIPDVALFDALSRAEFGPVADMVRSGETVITEVFRRRTKIAGLFELGASFAGNGHLVVSDETFRQEFNRPEGVFELGLIKLKPGSDVAAVAASLEEQLPDDVQVLTLAELLAIEKGFWQTNTPIGFIFILGAFIGMLVGAVIVYQILYTDVSDHLGEYATLKAMGYSDRQLHAVVLEQALILSVIGFPIGLILAQALYIGARNATHLPIEMTAARVSMVFGSAVLMCVLSGSMALRRLRSADPADVF